ncbi:response regulator [Endozoicomonas sp. SM1973]|uniref:Response regulator n=1 Tax=Spartinivicinus marinus TaxID=2994442 RepID=A0A853I8N9_9GAMM|nr:response regulator [Spartinivicinus marinus]MCX4028280.1 response regulator [Spartinivicinus marinus]NYZ65615.1 response regulator [Spartinivicinus marinus]
MNKILKKILLIDDNEADNFLHELIIKKSGITESVIAMTSATDALEYLKSKQGNNHPQPCLIFLDINMPRMNGWEFLEEYESLPSEQKAKVVIVMLTTSLNPDDKEKSNSIDHITEFYTKPLTQAILDRIIKQYFL